MASTQTISTGAKSTAPPGPWREFWTAFSANRGAVIGLVTIVLLLLVALDAAQTQSALRALALDAPLRFSELATLQLE